jgi:two-component system sensor histidine kinase UhpB
VLLFAVGLTLAYRVGGGFSRAVSELGTVARELSHQAPPQRMASNIREANNLLDDLKVASADLRATDWQQRFAIDAAEIGTWSWDIVQNRQIWSRRTREFYRLPADAQPSATQVFDSIHPDDLDRVRDNVQRCLAGQNSYEIEFRILRAGGSYRWVNGKGRVERDAAGTAVFMHGALQDITERKQIESDRAELRRRLMHAHEEERLRLAHELHDQTGQSLTAALLEVKQIGAIASHQGSVHLQRLREQLEDMGKTVHRIACELRPTAIEDLGLRAALANYLSDWSAKYGIAADFHFDGENAADTASFLSDDVQTTIYRIAQEGLTNIVKHAKGVSAVGVVINCTSSLLQLTIEDNGCGFDTTARIGRAGHSGLGLAGMRERAALVGGSLEVESSGQTGTTVFVRIPIEQRRQVA